MANEIRLKSRTTITAQDNTAALTAGYDPTSGSYTNLAAVTVIDNTYDGGSENGLGASFLALELNVTAAPSTAATAEIWYSVSEDGTNYTRYKYSHTVGDSILTSTNRYSAGLFELSAQYTKLAVVAVGYAFTAQLLATPKLAEIQ